MDAPRDFTDLVSLVQLANIVDSYHEFSSHAGVCDAVFGTTHDTLFDVASTDTTVTLLQPPVAGTVVELVFADAKVLPNVTVERDGVIRLDRTLTSVPLHARVKSTARTMAFAYVCAKPTVQWFAQKLQDAEASVADAVSQLRTHASDAFEAILKKAQAATHPCALERRQHLYETASTDVVEHNLLVEAAMHENCAACASVVAGIEAHKHMLMQLANVVAGSAQSVCAAWFAKANVSHANATMFSPPGTFDALTTLFDKLRLSVAEKQIVFPNIPQGDLDVADVLRICSETRRATRVRDAVTMEGSVVVQHWNDAAVSMAFCEVAYESVMNRMVNIVPDVPMDLVTSVATAVAAVGHATKQFTLEFKRRMRDFGSDITVLFEQLQSSLVQKLVDTAQRVLDAIHCAHKRALSLCAYVTSLLVIDTVMDKVQQQQRVSRVMMCKQTLGDDAVSRCPIGNETYIVYGSDSWHPPCTTQHGVFAQVHGRIYCMDTDCVLRRAGVATPSDFDAEWVADAVQRGIMTDSMQAYLDTHPCIGCAKTTAYRVATDNPSAIVCGQCRTPLHCPPLVREKHGSSECPEPFAGLITSVETGSVTCLGCGAVVCDAMTIENEEDERSYAEDGENKSRVAFDTNPYLSEHSNVTYMSLPSNATADMRKLVRQQRTVNTYVSRDDYSRTTTWVRRDAHVKIMYNLLANIRDRKVLRLTRSAEEQAIEDFCTIRWTHEKVCNVRIVMFALIARAYATSKRFAADMETDGMCTRCGVTMPRMEVGKHMRACNKTVSKQRKRVRDLESVTVDDVYS